VNTRPYDYIAYIDEAGDPGLRWVKPTDNKGSAWFVLSAVVVHADRESEVTEWVAQALAKLRLHQTKAIHFRKLDTLRKTVVCEHLADLPIRCFVMASYKPNMRRWRNDFAARKSQELVGRLVPNPNWFYFWCSRILMEKVSHFVMQNSMERYGEPRKVKLEFSENKSLSYEEIAVYFDLLKIHNVAGTQTVKTDDVEWRVMARDLVERHPHNTRAGLQMADVVASAFFKGSDIYDTNGCDPSFARILEPRMARKPDKVGGEIAWYGVKLMPWTLKRAKLPTALQESLYRFYGYKE
jgi:hypothetical protein